MQSDDKIRQKLRNKAVHYLSRYSATEARLRIVLERFATRKISPANEVDNIAPLIAEVVTDCRTKGYVNDQLFAHSKTESLRRQGLSRLKIKAKLMADGLSADLINDNLNAYDTDHEHNVEVESALIYARKRRIGPFTRSDDMRKELYSRHYANFARGGYSPKIISIIMGIEDQIEAERLLDEGYFD